MKEIHIISSPHNALELWHDKEKKALELLKLVGDLRFDKSIELVFFRYDLFDKRPSELINHHVDSINYIGIHIDISLSLAIVQNINQISYLIPAKIDVGTLCSEWLNEKDDFQNIKEFLHYKLKNFIGNENSKPYSQDVVLYGFGRIGRLLARRIITITGSGEQLCLKAIVIRAKMKNRLEELHKRAALLRNDSIHGNFKGSVTISPNAEELTINGNRVKIIFANHPSDVDYTEYGIDKALLIDNTGVWRDKKGLSVHLRPGISKVLLTAPGKEIPNIVYGANEKILDLETDKILSAASCTTNAIAPIISCVDANFGIEKGHIESIHAYTSDQNLLDNFHKKPRRGRAAALNMVLTSTGAAKAVTKVMPHLDGKLTGNAVRVPTPNVSLAIMSLTLSKPTSAEEINNVIREVSLSGRLHEQIHYSVSTEFVSSNAVGMTTTSILDSPSTIVSADGKSVTLYAWYDNEFGYCCQVVRLAKYVTKVRRPTYY